MRSTMMTTMIVGVAFGLTAFGDSIVIFNTGEGTGGTALPVGQTDLNYNVISAPSGAPLTALTTNPNPAWHANTAGADWISPGSSGGSSWPVGDYDYQTVFSLAGLDPSTAQLSGQWSSDNDACIVLNGVNTGICSSFAGFGSLASFSITSGFLAGTNTLDFVVHNGGGPTGVIAEVSGTAAPNPPGVPEPSSLSLLVLGTSFLGLRAFRRKVFRLSA
jgi:hypothetical protein